MLRDELHPEDGNDDDETNIPGIKSGKIHGMYKMKYNLAKMRFQVLMLRYCLVGRCAVKSQKLTDVSDMFTASIIRVTECTYEFTFSNWVQCNFLSTI